MIDTCPHRPLVFNSTLQCQGISDVDFTMRALSSAKIDASFPDPEIYARNAIATLRIVLENTISNVRSGEVSCVFTASDESISFTTGTAKLESVWLDADKRSISDAISNLTCNLNSQKKRGSLPRGRHDWTQHQDLDHAGRVFSLQQSSHKC